MANIGINDIKALRERTGAGMMDCKKALVEAEGDIETAIDLLRKKGLVAAAKKSGRTTAEGLVGVYVTKHRGTLIEVNTETDFVARNELFQKYVEDIIQLANATNCSLEQLKAAQYPGKECTVAEELTNLIAVIAENMSLRRVCHVGVSHGVVAAYVHNKITPTMGKIGILVGLESASQEKDKLMEFGKQIAMHIAAANPQSLSIEDLDPAIVERERGVVTAQAENMGKPPEFIQKIIDGRIHKFYEEAVLLEQTFVMDGTTKIKDLVANVKKEIGSDIAINGFQKFVLGEGIEKEQYDFAGEVAAQLS